MRRVEAGGGVRNPSLSLTPGVTETGVGGRVLELGIGLMRAAMTVGQEEAMEVFGVSASGVEMEPGSGTETETAVTPLSGSTSIFSSTETGKSLTLLYAYYITQNY
jgi:hypothetical protein